MPDRRAQFRFEIAQDISILDKRMLATLSSRHVYEAMTMSRRTLKAIEQSIGWLDQLHRHENRMLASHAYEDDSDAIAQQEQRSRLLADMEALHLRILEMAEKNSRIAEQMEEDLSPIYSSAFHRTPPTPIRPAKVRVEETLQIVPPPQAVETAPPVVLPQEPPTPAVSVEKKPVLRLDPKLIARARREIDRRAKEDGANRLSGPSIGTDTDGN